MEKFTPRKQNLENAEKQRREYIRKQAVLDLAKLSTQIGDPELAAHCILLHGDELDLKAKVRLIDTVLSSESTFGDLFAFRLLRDDPNLEPAFRDLLFEGLLRRNEKQTLYDTLKEAPNLGQWEQKLRERLRDVLQPGD